MQEDEKGREKREENRGKEGRRNFKIILEYDGTRFAGWQKQPGKRTIQGELENALFRLTGERVETVAAGRTDAGVHACGQVVSAFIKWRKDARSLAAALSAVLPEELAAIGATEAAAAFDARKDALERAYRYAILCRDARSPLAGRFCWQMKPPLDAGLMKKAAALFAGKHDFKAFCAGEAREWSRRRINLIRVGLAGPLVTVDIAANSFLRHMVRMVAGALAGVGKGRLSLNDIKTALKCGRGPVAGMAPSRGLALLWVRYRGERPGKTVNWPPLLAQ